MTVKFDRFKVTRYFSLLASVLLLFWWPLSHLFYSDRYHRILGFLSGSYQHSMVIVIGICGFLPVMNLILIAVDPIKHRANIVLMMLFSGLLVFMYSYLILLKRFPFGEILNIVISIIVIVIFSIISPWKEKEKSNNEQNIRK